MTKYAGKDARLFIGGYDVNALVAGVTPDGEIDALAYAVADGVGGYHYIRGLNKDTLKLDGIFDDNCQTVLNTMIKSAGGKQAIVTLGGAQSARAFATNALLETKYGWSAVTKDIVKLTAEFTADLLPWEECLVYHPLATRTTSGQGPSIDNGASSTNGASAYLQITSLGANDTLQVTIQESADNGAADPWADSITFTLLSGATATQSAERQTKSGVMKRYARVGWNLGGSAPYTGSLVVVLHRN